MPATATDALRATPLFQGMTDRSIEAVERLARPLSFAAGEALVRQGDPGDTFLIVVAGSATVTVDGATVRTLGPGDFLGEISLLDGGPRTATVVADGPVEALAIDRDGFTSLMDSSPVLRLDVVTALTQRLRALGPRVGD
ncbi:MAG: cyclic nucleotide-binding domain-containing protein [Candidatus Limnocylindria bacterium]